MPTQPSTCNSSTPSLSILGPYSTLSCQIQATNAWRSDLKSLFSRARERFPDVSWSTQLQDDEDDDAMDTDTDTEGDPDGHDRVTSGSRSGSRAGNLTPTSFRSANQMPRDDPNLIWAHKAILYARAPNTFQTRYLNLKTPAANLGQQLASTSTVSLPSIRSSAPSPDFSLSSRGSIMKNSVRGKAPPSSFKGRNPTGNGILISDSEDETDFGNGKGKGKSTLKRVSSKSSMGSKESNISGPILRNGNQRPSSILSDSDRTDSDNYSITSTILSSASTIKPPLTLKGISQPFFEATLEYLYTAEESMVEAFEFLYEDKVGEPKGKEEKLEKLRSDYTFMWRSKLFSDVKIVLGDDVEGFNGIGNLKSMPDNVSTYSLDVDGNSIMTNDDDEEEEPTSFSTHKMILVSRSPYFASQLLSPYSDSNAKVLRLPTPPFTPASLHFTLGFLYTGTLLFSNRTFDLSTSFSIFKSADYLQIDTLKNLISSLIASDFCHDFNCSPPCKTCFKRIPRTLAFTEEINVNDPHLNSLARKAVSGPHFGGFWWKEIGNLDYSVRGLIISDLISRVQNQPSQSIQTLRQLSILATKVDAERSTKWVEAIRWMSESVSSNLREVILSNLEKIVETKEFKDLIDGVGFQKDVLMKFLEILKDGLNDSNSVSIYQILVGKVILRENQNEDGERIEIESETLNLLEETRLSIIRFLKKKWINVRFVGGFNQAENWCLKELSHELEIEVSDLLRPKEEEEVEMNSVGKQNGFRSRTSTGSPLRGTSSSRGRGAPLNRKSGNDGEREAGPIHMRASILNRNAARQSVNSGMRLGNGTSTSASTSRQVSSGNRSPSVRSRSRTGSDEDMESSRNSSIMDRRRGSLISNSSVASTSTTASGSNQRSNLTPNRAQSTNSLRSVTSNSSTSSVRRSNIASTTPVRSVTKPLNRPGISTSSKYPSTTPISSTSTRSNHLRSNNSTTPTSTSSSSTSAFRGIAGDRTPTSSLLSTRSRVDSNASSILVATPSPNKSSKLSVRTPTTSLRSTRSTTSLKTSDANSTPRATTSKVGVSNPNGAKETKTFLKATPKPEPTGKSTTPISASTSRSVKTSISNSTPGAGGSTQSPSNTLQPKKSDPTLRKATSTSNLTGVKSVYAQQPSQNSKKEKVPALPSQRKRLELQESKTASSSQVASEDNEKSKGVVEVAGGTGRDTDAMEVDSPEDQEVKAKEPESLASKEVDSMDIDTPVSVSDSNATISATPKEDSASPPATSTPLQEVQSSSLNPATSALSPPSSLPISKTVPHSVAGTRLTLGIPCIIAPKNPKGKEKRLRATVKYIGPLNGKFGSWVGVEISEPLSRDLNPNFSDSQEEGFNDGTLNGTRYFYLGENLKENSEEEVNQGLSKIGIDVDSFRKPEREARKRRIARMIGNTSSPITGHSSSVLTSPNLIRNSSSFSSPTSTPTSSNDNHQSEEEESLILPSAKKRKDLKGLGLSTLKKSNENSNGESIKTRGLFLRPSEILWVVSGQE